MSFIILWISRVALSLLVVALITALASQCKKGLWRRLWPIFTAVLVFISVIPPAIIGGFFLWENIQPKWLFWYGLAETIAYLVGVIVVLKKGLQGAGTEVPAAKGWSRRWLAVSFGMAVFVFIVILSFAETKVVAHASVVEKMATRKVVSLLPANLPDALNAFPLYEEAGQMLGSRKDLPVWFREINRPDFDASMADVKDFLSKHQHTLAVVHQATGKPGYSMEVDASDFFNAKIPSYINTRNLAWLLRLSALSNMSSGRPDPAVRELKHIAQIGDHLRSYPLLISVAVGFAVGQTYCATLEHLLAHISEPEIYEIKLPLAPRPSVRDRLFKSLRLEAYSNLQFFASSVSSYDYTTLFNLKTPAGFDFGGRALLVKLWRVFLLPSEIRAAKDIIAFHMGKPAETYAEHLENWTVIKKAKNSGEMSFYTRMAAPDFSSYADRAMVCDVQRGLVDLALALTAYKAGHNEYPAELTDLIPDFISTIPDDPFDGQQLKLAHVEGGLRLFSTGPTNKSQRFKKSLQTDFYLGEEAFYKNRVKPALEKEGPKKK